MELYGLVIIVKLPVIFDKPIDWNVPVIMYCKLQTKKGKNEIINNTQLFSVFAVSDFNNLPNFNLIYFHLKNIFVMYVF